MCCNVFLAFRGSNNSTYKRVRMYFMKALYGFECELLREQNDSEVDGEENLTHM